MKKTSVAVLGCGHMGEAIAHALMQSGEKKIALTNHRIENLGELFLRHRECCKIEYDQFVSNIAATQKNTFLFLCVRPNEMKNLLAEIKPHLKKDRILISIAAGASMKKIKTWSGHKKIVRVMPNLGTFVGLGMSVWRADGLSRQERATVQRLLQTFGAEIEVKDESMIDAATAVSGSGPAYVFALLETLTQAAQKHGFKKGEAETLALMTLHGSTVYASQQSSSFQELKQKVQTKGGTTEAAFKVLDKKKWQKTLGEAIQKAFEQARSL